jgi:hypothetical protein
MALLVQRGIFKKIKISFLMVGHTHEDVDRSSPSKPFFFSYILFAYLIVFAAGAIFQLFDSSQHYQ